MLILGHSSISFRWQTLQHHLCTAAPESPLKQPVWLRSPYVGLEAAKEGSWHVFLPNVRMRAEAAAVIELTEALSSCLGLSRLQKRVGKRQVLGLALSHVEAAFQ